MNKKFLLLIILATEMIAILFMLFYRVTPPYSSDSASYIEQARYLKQGKGLVNSPWGVTESVNNDLEPAKVFPPGYPIMMYSLELLGIDEQTAAVIIPKTCFILLPIVLFLVLRYIFSDIIAVICSIFSTFMFHTVTASLVALSDTPFLFVVLVSIVFLFKSLEKEKLRYVLISGLISGFALLIRNVGYSLVLAAISGFVAAFIFKLASRKYCVKALLIYCVGIFIFYAPYVIRNIVVFNSIQPYTMPPSDYTLFYNIKSYFWALSESFFYTDYFVRVIGFIFLFLFGINIFYLLKDNRIRRNEKNRKKILYSFILFLYAAFGSLIVILARTKYKWGESINSRHLMQYNWVFVAYFMGMGIFIYNKVIKLFKFDIKPYVTVIIGCFAVFIIALFHLRTIKFGISNDYNKEIFNKAKNMVSYVSNLPKNTYVASNYGPWFRILTKRSVRQIRNISPQELTEQISGNRDIIVILLNDAGKSFEDKGDLSWQTAIIRREIPIGYTRILNDDSAIVLFCPKRN